MDFQNWTKQQFCDYYVHINNIIHRSGRFNHEFCKFPVPTPWDLNLLEQMLKQIDYNDMDILKYLHFGWPVNTHNLKRHNLVPPNQKGARDHPDSIAEYVEAELLQHTIIGGFKGIPFKNARISPIDAIPKKDSDDMRIITNLSFPDGSSVNDAMSKDIYLGQEISLTYPTVDDLANLVLEVGVGAAMFKTDLRKYFRQVYYDPGCVHLMGFRANSDNLFYWDIALSMGLRIACYIAQRLSNAIISIYRADGYAGVNYIDDLAGVAKWSRAYEAYYHLTDLLYRLNIWESQHKRCTPDVYMPFLGIGVNSLELCLSLTADRLTEIQHECNTWLLKKSASKKDLQRLIGKLNFAASTVRSGRLFYSRILTAMKNAPKHGIRALDATTKKDIRWWATFITQYDGISFIHENRWRKVDSVISTDACLQGVGGFNNGEYFHSSIPSFIQQNADVHINELECVAVVLALKIWGPSLSSLNIFMHCDNENTVTIVNKGRASNPFAQACLREIAYLAALYSFHVKMIHTPGVDNRISDYLSRWHTSPIFKDKFFSEVGSSYNINNLKQVLVTDALFRFSHNW